MVEPRLEGRLRRQGQGVLRIVGGVVEDRNKMGTKDLEIQVCGVALLASN